MANMRIPIRAIVAIALCSPSLAFVACSGDDTVGALPDAGGGDATGGAHDSSTIDVATNDGGACTPPDAGALDDAAVAAGLALVKQYKCQQCHGQVLSGNNNGVPSPFGGLAYPPNLTSDPATGLGCWTKEEIENAILNGIDDQGVSLCAPMPRFGDAGMDAASAAQIAEFLRSLAPVVNQVPETNCSAPDAGDGGDGGADAADASNVTDASDASDAAADVADAGDGATDGASD